MTTTPLRIVFLGAPGAGKGTMSQNIVDKYNIPQLSTGNMLREAVADKTEIGLKAKSFIDAGDLVPDDVVLGIIENRIDAEDCAKGFILDGFPRTVAQAEGLTVMLQNKDISLTHVFSLEVDEETVIQRRSGRLFAPTTGRVYHEVNNPPKVAGKCDVSGEELVKRDDDKEEVLRHRLRVYEEQTAPVKAYYEAQNMVQQFDAAQAVDDVFSQLVEAIENF